VLTKVVTEDAVPVATRRPMVPANVDAALTQALAKLPPDRFASAAQFAEALANPAFTLPEGARPTTTAGKTKRPARSIALMGALALAAGAIGWLLGQKARGTVEPGRSASSSVLRFAIDLPPGDTLADGGPSVAISPDGRVIVWVAERAGTRRLYRRHVDELGVEPISGTEGAVAPFFSPGGEWIAFFADGILKKVATIGGAVGEVTEAPLGAGSWGANGEIVIGPRVGDRLLFGLWRVQETGGDAQRITEWRSAWPQHVPGGAGRLFYTSRSQGEWQVSLYDGETDEPRVLIEGGSQGRYVATGHMVYAWNGSLLAAPFHLTSGERAGSPAVVVNGVWTDGTDAAHFSVSEGGRLVYAPGSVYQSPEKRLVWVDRSGRAEPLRLEPGPYRGQRVSPDGSKVVLDAYGLGAAQTTQLWTFEIARPVLQRLTRGTATEFWPTWDPTGRFVGHNSDRHGGPVSLHMTPADGSAPPRLLSEHEGGAQTAYSWRRDGRALAFQTYNDPGTWGDVWVYSFDDSTARPFLKTADEEFHPEFSPDGNWMAYVSDASGRWEVYVQPYPGPGGVTLVSTEGGTEPIWAPSGRELFYRDLSGRRVYAVAVETTSELRLGLPVLLFEGEFASGGRYGRSYDVTPDGRRFLMLERPPLPPNPTQLIVVDGWFSELERRVDSR
jgi:serine/threonine-protein kinase